MTATRTYRLSMWAHVEQLDGNLCYRVRERYYRDLVKDPCAYCGQLITRDRKKKGQFMTRDHIAPCHGQRKLPSRAYENLISACPSCNAHKAATPLLFFLLKQLPAS